MKSANPSHEAEKPKTDTGIVTLRRCRVVGGYVFAILVAALVVVAVCEARLAPPPSCTARPVNDAIILQLGKAKLHLWVRGAPCKAPPILWLHGGPGGAETPLFRLYTRDLERDRLVIYWDQRGAGRSYDPKADPAALTIARHLSDLGQVMTFLRARYHLGKIALVGHSWGATLGLFYAQDHPEHVAGVVAISPLISGLATQQAQVDFVRQQAKEAADYDGLQDLVEIGSPPLAAEDVLRLQGLVDRFGGYFHHRPSFAAVLVKGALSGVAAPWEVPRFLRANDVSLRAMNGELAELDLRTSLPALRVPVAVLLGRYDHQTEPSLAVGFLGHLTAPQKRIIWFGNSAHNIPFEEPERFRSALGGILGDPAWQ